MASESCSIQRAYWDVRILVPGRDATARGVRTARRAAVHCTPYDGGRFISWMVLPSRRIATQLGTRMGHSDAARRREAQGIAGSERQVGSGLDGYPHPSVARALCKAPGDHRFCAAWLCARLVLSSWGK